MKTDCHQTKMSKFIDIVTRPIVKQPAFFILLYVLLNVLDIYSLLFIHSYVPLYKAVSGFFICYILSLPTTFFNHVLRTVYKAIVIALAVMFFSIDLYLLFIYNETFSTFCPDIVGIVMATNPAEIGDFISTYFALDRLFLLLFLLSIILSIYKYLKNWRLKYGIVFNFLLLVLIFISSIYTLMYFNRLTGSNFFHMFTVSSPDLREFRQNPVVEYDSERPDNIVLILGESVSKSHCSVYGYEKQTTPFFEKMKSDSSLLVYDNVVTAGLSTIPAIKAILMGYTDEIADSIDWLRCLTLIEIMQKAQYNTFWVSNQTKSGLFTNEIGCFSDLCDEQEFIDNKGVFAFEKEKSSKFLDERLLGVLDKYLCDSFQNMFYIVHMMGSHYVYKNRYPTEFAKFSSKDYSMSHPYLSIENREIVSQYDNSILYSDSVIYEIFNKFNYRDAVVIYISDHGQDVFDSSNDYVGHAKTGNDISERSGREVPMMVYTTPLFRQKHPQLQQRIENAVNNTPYRTDSIMYSIMDIAGVETVNGVSYKHKSLFK